MKSLKLLIILLLISMNGAQAQESGCQSAGFEIVPLRVPKFDGAALWKKNLGVEGADRAASVVELADGGFIVAGDSIPIVKDDKNKTVIQPMQTYLTRFGKDGKQIWEKRISVENLSRVVSAVTLKDRIVVLSEISPPKANKFTRLDFYDGLGVSKAHKEIIDAAVHLAPKDMVNDKGNLMLALWATNTKDNADNYTIVAKLDGSGEVIKKQQYLPGVPNRPESIMRLADGGAIVTGQIRIEGATPSGWVMRIAKDGDIVFQRPYARGKSSILRDAVALANGNFMIAGDSQPVNDSSRGGWIMGLSGAGTPLWQKFMTSKFNYSAVSIAPAPDDRYLVVMNGRSDRHDHVRLETFSSGGKMLADDPYLEGVNSVGKKIIVRKEDRLLLGMSQNGLVSSDDKNNPLASYDIWLTSLPAMSDYKDPCAPAGDTDDDPENPF